MKLKPKMVFLLSLNADCGFLGRYRPTTCTILITRISFKTILHEVLHHVANIVDCSESATIYNTATKIIDGIL